MGTAFTYVPFAAESLLALAIGFAGTVARRWCSFERAEAIAVKATETTEQAGAIGWWAR